MSVGAAEQLLTEFRLTELGLTEFRLAAERPRLEPGR
jgi:hypothetical protein